MTDNDPRCPHCHARIDPPQLKAALVALFRDPAYQEMDESELLTRLLAILDPWYPDDLRPAPAPPEPLRKPRAYRKRVKHV